MKQKTLKFITRESIWLMLLLLPLVTMVVVNLKTELNGGTVSIIGFADVMEKFIGEAPLTEQMLPILINAFGFSVDGLNSLGGVLLYLMYVVYVYIFRVLVEFLIFIPKLCIKWMNHFTKTEE